MLKDLFLRVATAIPLLIFFILLIFYFPFWAFPALMALALIYILLFEWPKLFYYKHWLFWILMPFYPILPILLIMALHIEKVPIMTIFLFSSVCINDMAAYFAGNLFGKHKIWPKISPGKSWEGFLGGYIATLCVVSIIMIPNGASWLFSAIFAFLISSFALVGDMFESLLKRRVNLKDTGGILPGHGGLLDRLDAVMFVSFLLYPMRDYIYNLIKY